MITRWTGIRFARSLLLVCMLTGLLLISLIAQAGSSLPQGLILNLDFLRASDGLIPNRTLYPLHVPTMGLRVERNQQGRGTLLLTEADHLSIPHSQLLDPDGNDWIVSMRIYALTDGMILSQSNGQRGYAIYLKDGTIEVALQTGHSALIMRPRLDAGDTSCIEKWVTVELKITSKVALLILNREHVAYLPLDQPLAAKECRIRLGAHDTSPAPMKRTQNGPLPGFSGEISSLKILRQSPTAGRTL